MPDISTDTIQRLWSETKSSSWESLRRGLDEILRKDTIDLDMYNRILFAIRKLEDLGIDFPLSAGELQSRINFYM